MEPIFITLSFFPLTLFWFQSYCVIFNDWKFSVTQLIFFHETNLVYRTSLFSYIGWWWRCVVSTLSLSHIKEVKCPRDEIAISQDCFSKYQTKCVIKSLFRQVMTSQTLRFFLNQPLKQWLTGKKRGKDENTKIWTSQEQKELFRWNQKYFSVFEGLSFGEQ